MFDDDPILGRVCEIAHAFPRADEKAPHGRPAFFTKKVFAYYCGSLKIDGERLQHPHSIVIMPDPEGRTALLDASYRTTAPAAAISELDAQD